MVSKHRSSDSYLRAITATIALSCAASLVNAGQGPAIRVVPNAGKLEVTWSAAEPGYRVESAFDSMDLPVWRPIREAARKAGGQYRLTVPMDSESGFFRLMGGAGGPLAEDYPGDFADTNGDGIDGDFTRAIFLAPPPFGNDRNPGTALAPVATLEHAVELAESVPLRQSVYAAKGTYTLALPLMMPPRVNLFGFFDGTTNWNFSASNTTRIVGPSTVLVYGNYPGDTTDKAVRLVGVDIQAADATVPGGSSYGVIALDRILGLRIEQCRIVAGNGADGEAGLDGRIGLAGGAGGNGANAVDGGAGGVAGTVTGGRSGGTGGTGGNGAAGAAGAPGVGLTLLTSALGGAGGSAKVGCRRGDAGLDGAIGADGSSGTNALRNDRIWGSMGVGGYVALRGVDGLPGGSGSGGGGGGGGGSNASGIVVGCAPEQAAGGGGGGAGGLPGEVGRGGGGGGSSIAVYSLSSLVVVLDSELVTGNGGRGGRGGNGGGVAKAGWADYAATSLATVPPVGTEAQGDAEVFPAPDRVAPVDIPSPSSSSGNPRSPMISGRVTSIRSVFLGWVDPEVRPPHWERRRRGVAGWSCPWQHGRWGSERVDGGSWSDCNRSLRFGAPTEDGPRRQPLVRSARASSAPAGRQSGGVPMSQEGPRLLDDSLTMFPKSRCRSVEPES